MRIPPEYHEAILQRAAGGDGSRKIAAWLQAEHGVTASHVQVNRIVKRSNVQRAVEATHVARTKLAQTVTTDLDRLNVLLRKSMRLVRKCEQRMDVENIPGTEAVQWANALTKATNQARALIVEKLKRSGVESEDDDARALGEAEQRLRHRIAGLVAGREAGSVAEEPLPH